MPSTTEMDRLIQARHDEVLQGEPRIAPADRQSVAADVRDDMVRLSDGKLTDGSAIPLEKIPEIMFTMCRFPDLWDRLIDLTLQIQGSGGVLPTRDRKLAILRTGWLCQAPYEFGEHVRQAKRLGFATEEIERIIVGSSASEWNAHERAILQAVEELHDTAMVSDRTWEQLAKTFDDHELVELLVVVGQFTATAYFQNSMRLRLEPRNEGLYAR